MKRDYGVQLFGCSKIFREDTHGFFQKMKAAGITQIEPCIMFDDPDEFKRIALEGGNVFAATFPDILWLPHEVPGFKKELDELGMTLSSVHVFARSPWDVLPEMLRVAEENGITSYVVNTPEWAISQPDAFAEMMTATAAQLKAIGVELWLHNSGKDFMAKTQLDGGEVPVYLYILKKCENVFSQLDTGWVVVGDIDPQTFITENRSYIKGIHFKDMDRDFKNKSGSDIFAVLGTGIIDIKAVLALTPKNIPIVIDQDISKGDFIEDLVNSAQALRENDITD